MTYSPDLHENSLSQPLLSDRSDVPGFNLYLNSSLSVSRYLRLALQTLFEHNLIPPDVKRLAFIVEAALSAQTLFFTACLHDPGQIELHEFFETFILTCVTPPEIRSNP